MLHLGNGKICYLEICYRVGRSALSIKQLSGAESTARLVQRLDDGIGEVSGHVGHWSAPSAPLACWSTSWSIVCLNSPAQSSTGGGRATIGVEFPRSPRGFAIPPGMSSASIKSGRTASAAK